jgi:hypothetical protein
MSWPPQSLKGERGHLVTLFQDDGMEVNETKKAMEYS